MSGDRAAEDLAQDLARLRHRIDHVTATVLDKDLWARLSPIREHVSTTEAMLTESTTDALPCVADRLRAAERQLATVLRLQR